MRRIMSASDFARSPTKGNKRKRKEESAYMKKMSTRLRFSLITVISDILYKMKEGRKIAILSALQITWDARGHIVRLRYQ